jgi:nitronate monooxygenase
VGWPEEYSPRTIINKSFIEHQEGRPFDELKKLHDEAVKAGDAGWGPEGRLATYAGAAIGLIHDVKDAERIVQDVQEEVLQRLSNVQKANSAQ